MSDRLTAVDIATAEVAMEGMEEQRGGVDNRTAGVRRSPAVAAAAADLADGEDGSLREETAIAVNVAIVRAVRPFI